jgi:integral membrane sensor domain MASE1
MESVSQDAGHIVETLDPVLFWGGVILASLVALTIVVTVAVIYCKMFSKAGYHWALGLLVVVPIGCVIMPFVLAFGHWPIHRQLEELQRKLESGPSTTMAPGSASLSSPSSAATS